MPSAERRGRRLVIAGFLAATGIGLLGYPYLIDAGLARFGVRGVSSGLLVVGMISFGLGARARRVAGVATWPAVAIAAALALASLTGARDALLLVPAFVYLTLAETFRASLVRTDSIIERCARFIVPETPDFVRPYCRKLTGFWVGFFAASAVVIAGLALFGSLAAWQTVTGWGIYALMLAISGLEFFVRKTWFRYYFHGGLFDRFWARLFPAENTEQGRRSAAYIQQYREQTAHARGRSGLL